VGPLGDGPHTFSVVGVDAADRSGKAASARFTVDTTPPPAPVIGTGPSDPTTSTVASFTFGESERGATTTCQLDALPARSCKGKASYKALATGSHTFTVTATDAAGNSTAAAPYTWHIS
jgi:hypothetical protein